MVQFFSSTSWSLSTPKWIISNQISSPVILIVFIVLHCPQRKMIYKYMLEGVRGKKEMAFYESVNSKSAPEPLRLLRPFLPVYHGVVRSADGQCKCSLLPNHSSLILSFLQSIRPPFCGLICPLLGFVIYEIVLHTVPRVTDFMESNEVSFSWRPKGMKLINGVVSFICFSAKLFTKLLDFQSARFGYHFVN